MKGGTMAALEGPPAKTERRPAAAGRSTEGRRWPQEGAGVGEAAGAGLIHTLVSLGPNLAECFCWRRVSSTFFHSEAILEVTSFFLGGAKLGLERVLAVRGAEAPAPSPAPASACRLWLLSEALMAGAGPMASRRSSRLLALGAEAGAGAGAAGAKVSALGERTGMREPLASVLSLVKVPCLSSRGGGGGGPPGAAASGLLWGGLGALAAPACGFCSLEGGGLGLAGVLGVLEAAGAGALGELLRCRRADALVGRMVGPAGALGSLGAAAVEEGLA